MLNKLKKVFETKAKKVTKVKKVAKKVIGEDHKNITLDTPVTFTKEELKDDKLVEKKIDAAREEQTAINATPTPTLTGRLANRAARGKIKPKQHARGRK